MAELENKNDPFDGDKTQVAILLALLEIKDYLGAILEKVDKENFETTLQAHMQGFFVLPAPWVTGEANGK